MNFQEIFNNMDIDRILAEIMDANITPEIFISEAAKLVQMHNQTLRQYDKVGIVKPSKKNSPTRRYSQRDIVLLKEAKRLAQLGINKEGIKYILDLQNEIIDLKAEVDSLKLKKKNSKHVFESNNSGMTIINKNKRKKHHPNNNTSITIHKIEWIS
jgi:MerR family transcriptional regulator/heat shock protein HspR